MKNLITLVVFLIASLLQAQSIITWGTWECDGGGTNITSLNVGNQRVVYRYNLNWPGSEPKEILSCINGNCTNEGLLSPGDHVLEAVYNSPIPMGVVVLHIPQENVHSSSREIWPETMPSLNLEVLDTQTTPEGERTISFRISSANSLGYGWGRDFNNCPNSRKIIIETPARINGQIADADTIFCTPLTATDEIRTITYTSDGGLDEICLRPYLKVIADEDHQYAVKAGPQTCFELGELPTEVNDKQAVKGISVFPNPCTDRISLGSDVQISSWKVYNMLGELIEKGSGKEINVSAWTTGYYLLKVTDLNGMALTTHIQKE